MNWQKQFDNNWTSARARQWACAAIVSCRTIRLKSEGDDTLTKLRGAWQMFVFLRQYMPQDARRLRKDHGYSRFYEVFKKWQQYEMSPAECVEYLDCDLSNTAMAMQIEDIHSPQAEWERNAAAVYKRVYKLAAVNYGAPEWFVNWARDTKDIFERNGIK